MEKENVSCIKDKCQLHSTASLSSEDSFNKDSLLSDEKFNKNWMCFVLLWYMAILEFQAHMVWYHSKSRKVLVHMSYLVHCHSPLRNSTKELLGYL